MVLAGGTKLARSVQCTEAAAVSAFKIMTMVYTMEVELMMELINYPADILMNFG